MKNNLIRNFKIMFNRSLKPYYIKNFYNFQILDKVKIYSLILSLAFRNSKTIMKLNPTISAPHFSSNL